jgi:hypothetical protein
MTQIDRGPVRIGQWVVSVDLTLTDREASEIRARIIEWLNGPAQPIVLGDTAHLVWVAPDGSRHWCCHPGGHDAG